jgi:uncharacterized protein (DUF2384 family)
MRSLQVETIAEDVFGSIDKAGRWLRRPLAELNGESPLAMAQTAAGARLIETIDRQDCLGRRGVMLL